MLIMVLPKTRRDEILRHLRQHQSLSTERLAELVAVSPITVRRDLQLLEEQHLIERSHGGAIYRDPLEIPEPLFLEKGVRNAAEKRAIAALADAFTPDNATVILDSGTTTIEIARLLCKRPMTIIALDLKVAEAAAQGKAEVWLVGGRVRNHLYSLVGSWAEDALSKMHADLFFMSADAVSINGTTNSTFEEAHVKRLGARHAKRTVLVVDHSKFEQQSLVQVLPLEEIQTIITDSGAQSHLSLYKNVVSDIRVADLSTVTINP